MSKAIRTTIVFGLISALFVMPLAWGLNVRWGWSAAFKLTLWADLALYALLLARWSRTRLLAVLFPLGLLLGAALWPRTHVGFFLLALGVLSWIRSGICFQGTPLRALTAELITVAGGAGLVAFWGPHSALGWALGIWLFFLMQALYFFIIPGPFNLQADKTPTDPFEQARSEAEKVLGIG